MTQVRTLVFHLKRRYISTADAFNLGICSFHRRLQDVREKYPSDAKGMLIDGVRYHLKPRDKRIKTRWGDASIRLWKLVRA